MKLTRIASWMVAILASAWIISAHALTKNPGDGSGGGTKPGTDRAHQCIEDTNASFKAAPPSIPLGARAALSWSVQVPSNCSSLNRGLFLNGTRVTSAGSMLVQPMSNRAFTLQMQMADVTGTLGTTTVSVTLPSFVRITGNTPEWRRLFIQAVDTPNTLVLLAHNLDLDLTNHEGIFIRSGVTLTSEAPPPGNASPSLAAAGPPSPGGHSVRFSALGSGIPIPDFTVARDARNLGPRLYTTNRAPTFLEIRCFENGRTNDHVRISGFRLLGPSVDPQSTDEAGIRIVRCVDIEISNMEIAGWGGQGIAVEDDEGPDQSAETNVSGGRISNPDQVKIHNNFIHHNQHPSKHGHATGYGVGIGPGAWAQISENVFDFNRHAIAANAKSGGYFADRNLVLKGGGYHGTTFNKYTHQFDVHGTGCWWSGDLCGDAGIQFRFDGNSFQYRNDNAIKIRGKPRLQGWISNNVFPHEALENDWGDDAITLQTPENVVIGPGNVIDRDTYGQYGVCDFDGDGKDDLFLATGVSWWYSSGAAMHWVYLNNATERLHQVGLGDFDGDRRCDVLAASTGDRWEISSGGKRPWSPLPGIYPVPFDQLRFADFNGDGTTDVFRRARDGQWYVVSPGKHDWRALQSSSFPLSGLRFGDFNNDRVADVIAVQNGRWSVSWGGTTAWQPLNPRLSDRLETLLIADINADGLDDILRYTPSGDGLTGTWVISRGGAGAWEPLATLAWVDTPEARDLRPARAVRSFVGRFNDWAGADLLALDHERKGHIHSNRNSSFVQHSLYAF